jgi:hypothetical protein
MPSRVIREGILNSPRYKQLSERAALFYRHLMSVVDDFGRYSADPPQLRGGCFPVWLDRYTDADVVESLRQCVEANLVATYEVKGEPYLEFLDFNQRTRLMRSKWPLRDGEFVHTWEEDIGGGKKSKRFEIRHKQNDGQMTVSGNSGATQHQNTEMTVNRPSNDGLIPIPNPIPKGGGEGCRASDGQMTGIPTFEPVKPNLWPREYDDLLKLAQQAIDAIKRKPENFAKDLTKGAEEFIAFMETEKPDGYRQRIDAALAHADSYERKDLKPKPAAIVEAWKSRIEAIRRAKAGIKN